MLIPWKDKGIDKILKKAWETGMVLAGISTESLCWFKGGNIDSFGKLENMQALDFYRSQNLLTMIAKLIEGHISKFKYNKKI